MSNSGQSRIMSTAVEVAPVGRHQFACFACLAQPEECTHRMRLSETHDAHLIGSSEITREAALDYGSPTLLLQRDSLIVFVFHVMEERAAPLNPIEALAPLGPDLKNWTPDLRIMVERALSWNNASDGEKHNARAIEVAAAENGVVERPRVLDLLGRGRGETFTRFAGPVHLLIDKLKRASLISPLMPPLLNAAIEPGRTAYYKLPPGSY